MINCRLNEEFIYGEFLADLIVVILSTNPPRLNSRANQLASSLET